MTFYKIDEVPISRDDQVFKESPTVNATAAFILFGIAIAALVCGIEKWPQGKSPTTFFYFTAVMCTLIGLFPLAFFRASLKPTNWLLRCQLGGIFIKYRGYENWRLPADTVQVAGIEYGEIAWAKLVKEQRKSPNTDGKAGCQIQFLTYIDLGLTNPDLSALDANLQRERALRPDTGLKVVVLDFPVQVLPGGIVEIRWGAGIRPSPNKALQAIGQRVKILETEHRKTDLTHHTGANPEEEKAKILALAKSGDRFGAVKLAQQVYGYKLTDATTFVDQLAPDGMHDDD
jgi:hypothetical protein